MKKLFIIIASILLISVWVSACGKETDGGKSEGTTEAATRETTAVTTEKKDESDGFSVEYYSGDELLKTDSVKAGDEYSVSYTPDAVDGYTFNGWKYENGDACGERITISGSVKLYADITANTYTVIYGADGGDITKERDTVTYGQFFTLEVPTKRDFVFEGWFDGAERITDKDGKSLSEWKFLTNKELMASWLPERKLILSSADIAAGSVSGDGTYYEGETVTATATPNLGYRFIGWYDGADLVSEDTEYTFTITFADRAYEARWEVSEEMSLFEFVATTDTCVITGVKDKTVNELYIPSFVTEFSDGAFEGSAATVFLEYKGGKYQGNAENLYHTIYEITDKTVVSFELHPSLKAIGDAVFLGCTALEEIELPLGLESIGTGAFNGCTALSEIVIPDGVTVISEHAFNGCASLESVTLPVSLAKIGNFAFNGCVKLESITLPVSLERIGVWAFQKCDGLESVTFGETEGWTAGIEPISASDLEDTAKAALYLKTTYYSSLWRRK